MVTGGKRMSGPRRASAIPLWLSLTAVVSFAGCGGATDNLPRRAISGEVKLDGAPLKAAMIQFMPTDPASATAGGAAVTDGKYSIPTADGLVPGAYTVAVTSVGTNATTPPAGSMPGDPLPPAKESIPSAYNSKTTLTATVKAEGPNVFNFELKSK